MKLWLHKSYTYDTKIGPQVLWTSGDSWVVVPLTIHQWCLRLNEDLNLKGKKRKQDNFLYVGCGQADNHHRQKWFPFKFSSFVVWFYSLISTSQTRCKIAFSLLKCRRHSTIDSTMHAMPVVLLEMRCISLILESVNIEWDTKLSERKSVVLRSHTHFTPSYMNVTKCVTDGNQLIYRHLLHATVCFKIFTREWKMHYFLGYYFTYNMNQWRF